MPESGPFSANYCLAFRSVTAQPSPEVRAFAREEAKLLASSSSSLTPLRHTTFINLDQEVMCF